MFSTVSPKKQRKKKKQPSPEPEVSGEGARELDADEYMVDCILHETQDKDGNPLYLIRWQGYPLEESTWEPEENITAGASIIFARWEDDKRRIQEGFSNPFDLDDFEAKQFAHYNPGVTVPIKTKVANEGSSQDSYKAKAPRKMVGRTLGLFVDSDDSDNDGGSNSSVESLIHNSTTKGSLKEQPPRSTAEAVTSARQDATVEKATKELSAGSAMLTEKQQANSDDNTTVHSDTNAQKRKADTLAPNENHVKKAKTSLDGLMEDAPPRAPSSTEAPVRRRSFLAELSQHSNNANGTKASAASKTSKPKALKDAVPQKVFGDSDPKTRTHTLADDRFYSPSHIQNIIKKNSDGAAPDPQCLVLRAPGEFSARPYKHQDAPITTPSVAVKESFPKLQTQRMSNRSKTSTQEMLPTAHSVPLLCAYFVAHRECPEGENRCRFLHQRDGGLATAAGELHTQARQYSQTPERFPKFHYPAIVCGHHFSRTEGCFREHRCLFAHWKPVRGGWKFHNGGEGDLRKLKTCSFWAKGKCIKTAEACPFAHEWTGEVAAPRTPTSMTCVFWFESIYGNGFPCTKGDRCLFLHELTTMLAPDPRTKTGPCPIDPALIQANAATNSRPSRPEHMETIKSPIQRELVPRSQVAAAEGQILPEDQNVETTAIVSIPQPSTLVDGTKQVSHAQLPKAASQVTATPENNRAEAVKPLPLFDDLTHADVGQSGSEIVPEKSTGTIEEIAMGNPPEVVLIAPDEDMVDGSLITVPEKDENVEVEPPTPCRLTITFGDKETHITLLMHPDHANFIEQSVIDNNRRVEARPVMHDETTQFIYPMYEEVLDTGFIDPGEDVLETARLAGYLYEAEMFLTIKIGWTMLMLYPTRPNVEDEEAEAENVLIGFEFRAISEHQRAEFSTENPADDDVDDVLWTDIDEDDEDIDEDEVLNDLAKQSFSQLFDMKFEDLFTWPTQTQGIMKEVFLLVDNDREAEMQALSRLLEWNGAHVSVPEHDEDDPDPNNYTWQEFKELGEGVVIIDSRITAYRDVEFLSYLLFSRFNFFELDCSGQELVLRPLFENGHTLFLTDQVLQEQPSVVLDVVIHVKERNKSKMPGSESRRIFARPGVVGWLQELCEEVSDDISKVQSYYTLSQELSSLVPIDSPRDAFELSDRVLYEPSWLDAHGQTYKEDPIAATKALVGAFDLTFCQHREMSRNWIVLHPKSTFHTKLVEQLSEEFCNLHFMSVEDYISKAMNKATSRNLLLTAH